MFHHLIGKDHVADLLRRRFPLCHAFQVGFRFRIPVPVLYQRPVQYAPELFILQGKILDKQNNPVLFLSEDLQGIVRK